MNAHPFLAVGLALILAVGGAVALAPARADDAHARPVVAVAPPHPAPAGDQAPHAAKPEYFAGRAGELLRYLAAGDVVQVAADGEALRRLGATTKPTSVIADPAYAPVFQRVLARWPADSDSRLLMENVGLIWSTTYGPDDVADPMCIWMPDRAAFFADKVRQDDPDGHRTIGGFEGGEKGLQFLGVSDGTFILTRCADRLSPRLVRRPQADQAELRTAPLWLRVDAGAFLARARDADVAEADPLGIGRWLPEWREVRPLLTAAVTPEADGWRGTATLSGIRSQPLRHVDAAFAQMISGTPLAGVAVAVDMGWLRRALAGFDGASRDAFGCGIDDVLSLVSGDAVMVAEAGSPFPSLSLILGTRDDPGCAATLQRVLQRIGATSNGDRRWSMMTPIGALTFVADHSRLVITTGGDPQRWLGVPSGRSSDDHGLIMTADLPMLVRTYWPMVVALLPDAPDSSNLLFDRTTVPDATTLARHCPPYRLTVTPRADGLTVEECGLPACVVVGGFLLIFEMQNADPRYLIERATDARTEHQVRDEHARALAVMAHVAEILRDHYADEPPTCLSQLVVDGRLTLAELAPLCGGVTPTDNATVDAIGAWYPDTCGWTVRLSGCWKATIRLRTGDLVVVSTSWCDPTMPTAAQRRGPVKRDAPKDGNGF